MSRLGIQDEQTATVQGEGGQDRSIPRLGCDHLVHFYDEEDALWEVVADYLAEGLGAGEPVVVIATAPHRQAFTARLRLRGLDLDGARHAGRLTWLDAHQCLGRLLVSGMPDWERFRSAVGGVLDGVRPAGGGGRVRVYGEMVQLLWQDGERQAAIRLEELWGRLGELQPFSLLCAYVLGNFYKEAPADECQRVRELHTQVIPSEVRSVADLPARLRETGLIDHARALEREVEQRKALEQELREALAERRRVEESLRLTERELLAANRTKDEFLAMLGHELRNPLAPILMALELMRLRLGQSGGPVAREREIIERQVTHLVRLVDDLLDLSRITGGKVELRRRPVELGHVVARAIEMSSPLLEQKRHWLATSVPREGLCVDGDEDRLAQVLSNLVTNAAKYMDPGGRIEVTAEQVGGDAVLRVRDTGHGISAELLPRLFKAFVQGERTIDRSQGGLGLGLAIVHNLVALHGGTVSAHSDGPGRGSEFMVRLPLVPRRGTIGGWIGQRSEEHAAPWRTRPSGRRLLIVDDNRDAAVVLAELLDAAGHPSRVAFDGPSALDVALEHRPEVAIVDIGLPGMDGYELARRLRELPDLRGIRIAALTGYGQRSDRERSRAAGMDEHLVKPVTLEEIERMIHRLFDGAQPQPTH